MSSAVEIAVAIFAVSNSVRVMAYVPQIIRVARDRDGAAAISCLTWLLFAVSHLSTAAYAVVVINDWWMAAIFGVNVLCCMLIIGLTVHKRALAARQFAIGLEANAVDEPDADALSVQGCKSPNTAASSTISHLVR